MEYKECLSYLNSIETRKYNLDLKNIKSLLSKLGNPHKALRFIHVAGTNGKGSVCTMISSIMIDAGYKVGTYTSPHLRKINERFRIDNKDMTDMDFARFFSLVKEKSDNETYFELLTATAFLYFKEMKVDIVVLEVGLGGRLDATNVVHPILSVITNISLEHQQYLGSTVEKIAKEKAGIIKKGIPVVTGTKGEAFLTIKRIAKQKGSKVLRSRPVKTKNGSFDINGYKNLRLKMIGRFQKENASIVLSAIEIIKDRFLIGQENIKNGLRNAYLNGRMEFKEKDILLDCAHNPNAIKTLRKEIENLDKKNVITIIGILKDKDKESMVKEVSKFSSKIIFTKPNSTRAEDPIMLCKFTKRPYLIINDVKNAIIEAKKSHPKLIVVTGSFYTVGKAI
jgi:dihydrofolate synthase/folylpolyglutamate synthase